MLPLLAIIESHLTGWLASAGMLLAQSAGKSLSIPWAIVGFLVILGLIVTLSPSRRTFEIKRPRDE